DVAAPVIGPGIFRIELQRGVVVGESALVILLGQIGRAAVVIAGDALRCRLACVIDDAGAGGNPDVGRVGIPGTLLPVGGAGGKDGAREQGAHGNDNSAQSPCHHRSLPVASATRPDATRALALESIRTGRAMIPFSLWVGLRASCQRRSPHWRHPR